MTHTSVVLLIVVLSLVDLGRASYLMDTETGDRREAGADQQQVDALVEYLIKRIQREQEFPSYSGSLVLKISFLLVFSIVVFQERLRLIPKSGDRKRASPFNNNYADAVFRGLG